MSVGEINELSHALVFLFLLMPSSIQNCVTSIICAELTKIWEEFKELCHALVSLLLLMPLSIQNCVASIIRADVSVSASAPIWTLACYASLSLHQCVVLVLNFRGTRDLFSHECTAELE